MVAQPRMRASSESIGFPGPPSAFRVAMATAARRSGSTGGSTSTSARLSRHAREAIVRLPELASHVHPLMDTALLIIDVQQGLCEGEHVAFELQQVIARINIVSAKARAAGALVIFVQHESASGYLEFGTDAWQLARGLHTEASDVRLRKTTPDSFHRTELQEVLRSHAVSSLIVCGMHTEFCVDTTTRRALALGFPVVLVEDAHTTEANEHLSAVQIIQHHNDTLTNITSFGPRVRAVSSDDLRLVV